MKKIILVLFGLMLTSVAFSQAEGYLQIFKRVSLIENNGWVMTINRAFELNGKNYVLAYEPLNVPKIGSTYNGRVTDKDLYLYCKDVDGWRKASLLIRHDYFHGHYVNGSYYPDSLRVLDVHTNSYDSQSYGSVNVDPDGIVVTIRLKTLVWKSGEPIIRDEFEILTLTPNSDGMFDFIFKTIKK